MNRPEVSTVFGTKALLIASWAIKITGILIAIINLILDLAYIFKVTFAGSAIYGFYCILIMVRFLGPVAGVIRNLLYKVNDTASV